jgi:putative addiction module component (TIGR02574 family)
MGLFRLYTPAIKSSWDTPFLIKLVESQFEMSAASALDKQIFNYLTQLNARQKKAVLTVVKTFAEEQESDSNPWKDASFVAEMDRRMAELENGKVKGYTWEEVKQRAKGPAKLKKRK